METTNRFYQTTMIGMIGKAVSELNPEGTVKIRGELWQAIAADGTINRGEEITVFEQERLILKVARSNTAAAKGTHS